jgi:MFS family permease
MLHSQEIFFLHERGTFLMLQQTIQTIATAIFVLFASPIAEAITPRWWYGLGACLSGVSLIMAFVFVPETKYHRPLSSFQEDTPDEDLEENSSESPAKAGYKVATERPALDFVAYNARTWRSDLRLWIGTPEWRKGAETLMVSYECHKLPDSD